MKKVFYVIIILILASITISCSRGPGEDTKAIKAPTNNALDIYGSWKIQSIKVLEGEVDKYKNIDSLIGNEIELLNNKITLMDMEYLDPSYKLKVVDKDYILSYESNFKIEPFMNGKDKIDVISIISNNNMIGEFIKTEKDKGYIVYMGNLLEVEKDNASKVNNDMKNEPINKEEDIDYYESEVGAMLALKKPREINEDGSFTNEEYRTLWISFKDGKLMPIIEKDEVIFPRMNGIWSLDNRIMQKGNYYEEYFEVKSLDSKTTSTYTYEEINDENIYRNITFVGNNYVGIEEYRGDNFNNIFTDYKVIPVDNINSSSGLDIDDIYSKDINNKYEFEYKKALDYVLAINNKGLEDIDYSNFTVKRKDGKWGLVGSLGIINSSGQNEEYLLNLRPNSKMLNYDNLTIPWKILKAEIPFIRDAYISPNERIAIVLFDDNLAIYEVQDKMLKGVPLASIKIGNEEVVMTEWATYGYVEKWAKVFSDGEYIKD
ncbi:MAG: hypothetical protein ACRDA5_12920 [Clostridium sp.]